MAVKGQQSFQWTRDFDLFIFRLRLDEARARLVSEALAFDAVGYSVTAKAAVLRECCATLRLAMLERNCCIAGGVCSSCDARLSIAT